MNDTSKQDIKKPSTANEKANAANTSVQAQEKKAGSLTNEKVDSTPKVFLSRRVWPD